MGTKKKYFSTCRNWYQGAICGKKADLQSKVELLTRQREVSNPGARPEGVLGLLYVRGRVEMVLLTVPHQGMTVLYECCPGYMKLEGMKGCPAVRSALVSNVNIELYNALHYHMANKRLLTKDLKNGLIVTVNCARIIHGNQVATNGVVHVIDRVITAVGNTIQDVIEVDDDLTTLSEVALASGLLDKLGQPGQYTLFAPTNDAFAKLDSDVLQRLMGDKGVLQALLNFHMLNSVQCSEGIMSGQTFETLEGHNIEIGCDGNSLTVNGIKMVLKKDIVTTNGVIHLIDEVLMPDSAKQVMDLLTPSQSTFSDMVSELDEVMAIDQSFLKAVCIENSCLVRGSKEGSNGALHLMRTLMKPAETTMFQILTDNGGFKIFLSLMETAGLTDLLKQEGEYTLFTPSDEAFAGISDSDLALLRGNVNALRTILLYHFSNGVFIGGGLETGVTNLLKSLQGNNLRVLHANNTIRVNSIEVPEHDIMATNGVIHFVKTLLYPGELPVGNSDLLGLLRRLIKYMEIKFVSGYSYKEIPLTFMKRTTITRVIESVPDVTHVTRVIEREPTITKVTRVIEGQPAITKVTRVIEGEPKFTKVTRVIEGEPKVTKVTRVVSGPQYSASSSSISNIELEGADFSHISTIEGNPSMLDMDSEKITKFIQGKPETSNWQENSSWCQEESQTRGTKSMNMDRPGD
ncbi:unnamed protein product [Coregonus sp. 'balchen']|nr:unnamed protein product [Coregonus sp. 'balchen']